MDQDKKDEDAKKKGNIDYSKIEAAVSSNKELALKAKPSIRQSDCHGLDCNP